MFTDRQVSIFIEIWLVNAVRKLPRRAHCLPASPWGGRSTKWAITRNQTGHSARADVFCFFFINPHSPDDFGTLTAKFGK
jgi:hypothetical protein